jgi:hypothetical protein
VQDLDKNQFLEFSKHMIESKMSARSNKEKQYAMSKSSQIIDLFIELESLGYLKDLSSNYKEIENKTNNTLQNVADLNKLRADLTKIITNSTRPQIILSESDDNKMEITGNQYAIQCGITYSAFCELIKSVFVNMINFKLILKKIGSKKKRVNGIGELIETLHKANVRNMEFFEHIDSQLRNSFSHMEFITRSDDDNGRLYCNFNKKIYESGEWKNITQIQHDTNQKYMAMAELMWQDILSDLSSFVLLGCSLYVIKRKFESSI